MLELSKLHVYCTQVEAMYSLNWSVEALLAIAELAVYTPVHSRTGQ